MTALVANYICTLGHHLQLQPLLDFPITAPILFYYSFFSAISLFQFQPNYSAGCMTFAPLCFLLIRKRTIPPTMPRQIFKNRVLASAGPPPSSITLENLRSWIPMRKGRFAETFDDEVTHLLCTHEQFKKRVPLGNIITFFTHSTLTIVLISF